MYTQDSVINLLKSLHQFSELRFKGDVTASDILIDLQNIVNRANPTNKQRRVMYLVWVEGYTLDEVGTMFGISHQAVAYSLELLKNKINKALKDWRN